MEELNKLIEQAIIKYDNFGEPKPTKQSSIKAYRDIICKLHTAVFPDSECKYPNSKELCKIFENHSVILKKLNSGDWVDLSASTKKNYLNVLISIIPKIKSIEPDFTKSMKWVVKKTAELKEIWGNYKIIIETLKKVPWGNEPKTNEMEKEKEIDETEVEEEVEEEEPVIEKEKKEKKQKKIPVCNIEKLIVCSNINLKIHNFSMDLDKLLYKKLSLQNELILLEKQTDDIIKHKAEAVKTLLEY
jgi:hypothetical protein